MAKYKNQCSSGSHASRFILILTTSYGSGSVSTNTTPSSYTLQLAGGNYDGDNYNPYGSSFYGYTCNGTIKITNHSTGATIATFTGSSKGTVSNTSAITIASGSVDLPHNSDGTLNIDISCSFSGGLSSQTTGGSLTASNVAITTIPRQATVNSATNFNDEGNPTITYTNSAGNAVTTLQACIALTESSAASNPLISYRDISKTGSSYTFSLTTAEREALRSAMASQNSRNVWFFVKTVISGTTYYSYKIATLSIVNANPLVNSVEYEDTNAQTTLISGNPLVIIRNKSQLAITVGNIWSYKSATLVSMTTTINGITVTTSLSGTHETSVLVDSGTINVSSDTNATIVVTDSRGNTVTYTLPITIWDWVIPSAIYNIYRLSNFYTESKIIVDANYSSLDGNNTIDIKYRIKKHEEATWGAYVTLQDNTEADFNADNLYAWDVQIVVTDRLGSYTYTINKALDIGIPILFIDVLLRSVGINYFPKNSGSIETDGIDLRNIYSTDEKKVGTWIDGKPIYRKTIEHSISDTSAITTNISTGITNMETLVKSEGTALYNNTIWLPLTFYNAGGFNSYHITQSGQSIVYQRGSSNYPTSKVYITLEYTKTTD